MGVFGTGLYSGDFAMDLRSAVSAVTKLPLSEDELVHVLRGIEPAADNENDDDHTVFWLVLADQFAKRGIASNQVTETALAIIDSGHDVAKMQQLGLDGSGVTKRKKMLSDLRDLIVSRPNAGKPRKTIKKPQELILNIGDVIVYPTCNGQHINPYFKSKDRIRVSTKEGPKQWTQDGWGAMVIVDNGLAFGYLAWYRPLTMPAAKVERPSLPVLLDEPVWVLDRAGTCSTSHARKMELEKIGDCKVDPDRVRAHFPKMRPGTSAAISDISIANAMNCRPSWPPETTRQQIVDSFQQRRADLLWGLPLVFPD